MNKKDLLLFMLLLSAMLTTRPALGQYTVRWGDVHGHTDISDGKGSLDDYFIYARDFAKLDFVIVTDHDFGNSSPWRMPGKSWKLIQEKADQYTVNGRFVAIAGYEWTSQSKYWTPEEALYTGPVRHYNHKNVYFPNAVDYIFSAKDIAYNSPNRLAHAVLRRGGLIHNNHPAADEEGQDQFDYDPMYYSVIVNTEMLSDVLYYQGKAHILNVEKTVRNFLDGGGKTGFVGGTDTHEGKPGVRTAVLTDDLSRQAIFGALRRRLNYAISNARIVMDFRINGHPMGEEIEIKGKPRILVDVKGTDNIEEVIIVRDGSTARSLKPGKRDVRFEYVDSSFNGNSYYYLRVTQVDKDEHGNPSRAWSSPIWVRSKR